MNNQIEFIKYEPVANEKFLGIATIRLWGKITLRYKIVTTKDGSNIFPAIASYKGPSGEYINCFTVEYNSEKEEIETLIKAHVRKEMNAITPPVQNQSAYVGSNNLYPTQPQQHQSFPSQAYGQPSQENLPF